MRQSKLLDADRRDTATESRAGEKEIAALAASCEPVPIRRIDVPALFITGTFDVNAPVAQTEQNRTAFPRSAHIIVENAAHETLPIGAVQDAFRGFYAEQLVSGTVTVH